MKYSLAVNSVGLIVSHESTGVSYRWLKSARTLLRIVQLTFRYLDQIRLDVIESGVLVQHLCKCWWIVIGSGTSTVSSRWFKASSPWLFCNSAILLHISVLHDQQLLMTDLDTVSAPLNLSIFQDGVPARIDWILIQDGVVRPFWRGLIRRPLAKEFSAVLMCRFSSALLTYPAHVLLASEPSSWSAFLSILVTCTWTLRIFPSSNHTFKASVFIVSNQ